jgi:hypothetical protein
MIGHESYVRQMARRSKTRRVDNYEDKWSPLYGIRKVRWMFPLGHAVAKQKRCQVSGWQSVLKKRFRKKVYGILDFDLYYLDPFENGTLLQVAEPDVELTMAISDLFITSLRLGFQIDADAHLHESKKDYTTAQGYINNRLKGRLRYCRRLSPYHPMQLENEVRISAHFNMFTPHHPGYLQAKKNQPSTTTIPNSEKWRRMLRRITSLLRHLKTTKLLIKHRNQRHG